MSTEQKAWQLHENGVSFSDIQMTAIQHGCTSNHAIELIWDEKLGNGNLVHCCQPTVDSEGWEKGCCHGK